MDYFKKIIESIENNKNSEKNFPIIEVFDKYNNIIYSRYKNDIKDGFIDIPSNLIKYFKDSSINTIIKSNNISLKISDPVDLKDISKIIVFNIKIINI